MRSLLPDIPIDYGPEYQFAARIDQAQFGDGYVQRRPAGINNQRRSYNLQWTLLSRDEYDELHLFLSQRLNLTPFLWQAPWDDVLRQWICTSMSGPRPTSARFANMQAAFIEDFTP